MRCLVSALIAAVAVTLLPTVAHAADNAVTVVATEPGMPTAIQSAAIGLSLTAVVVIAARVTQRTSNTMMYMTLASLAFTAVLVAASDRVHTNFEKTAHQLQQTAAR
jgi:hypothetical protein